MNILTFGFLVGELKIDNFTVSSKVIFKANELFPSTNIIDIEMTGLEIIEAYKKLSYEVQTSVVDLEIVEGLEERNFYKELELHREIYHRDQNYNKSITSNILIVLTSLIIFTFITVAVIYHYNTVENGDKIDANLVNSLFNMVKYVILNFL